MDEHAGGMPDSTQTKGTPLHQRYQTLESKKLPIYRRCEDYALWTLPYIFPLQGSQDHERQGPIDSTGPQAVNNLSNKLVMTLFPPHSPFFRLNVSDDVVNELNEAANGGDEDAKAVMDSLDESLADAEKAAMTELGYSKFRTESTNVTKALIILGNALEYHPEDEDGSVQSYGLRDYCVVRDSAGTVVELMTRDKKALNTFTVDEQDAIKKASKNKKYKDGGEVTIYSRFILKADGKYHMTQAADEYRLPEATATWTKEDFPYVVLVWNITRGEDYGRGLVEDYAGAFHALHILNHALNDMTAIASDIKFFVDPASVVDVKALNDSESGSYHSGREGDVSTPEFRKTIDMAFVMQMIERYEKQIGAAFLLNSAVRRDAERVTAEEIRQVANELEIAHGGVYSRFAEDWQLKLAVLMLNRLKFKIGKDKTIFPQIITGIDSLSRAGDLDNLRLFISDMTMLEAVPDDIRRVIDPLRFASYIGVRRGVDYEKFTKTPQQLQQEEAQLQAQQQQEMANQAGANIAEDAAKQAIAE